jgi:hypothetical protein
MQHTPLLSFHQKNESNSSLAFLQYALAATFLIALTTHTSSQAQTAVSAAKEDSLVYTVKASDSVIKFTQGMLMDPKTWPEVARFNQLKNPNVIFPGQKLDIPLRFLKAQPAGGKIISAEGDVSLGGSAASPGAAIGDGSKLKTGPNSSAVIELGDGSRVKILPNSLAELVTNRNYAMRDASSSGSTNWFSGLMRLSEGALEALASKTTKRATPLKIETPTSVVGVRGTEFRVAFDDPLGKASRTEVIEGKVRADNPAQASGADLPMGTGAVVKPTEKEVKVVMLLPAPDLSNISNEVLKPQGSWLMPTLAGASAYHVQVASDEQFDKIVRDLKVANNASADLSSLPNGNWFARVRGIDAIGLEGFNSVKLIAVKDTERREWRVTYSSINFSDGKTALNWDGQQAGGQPMAASSYTATLARDAALTQSAVTLQSAAGQTSMVLGDLKPGVYYISLQNAAGLRSQTYRFELSGNWAQTEFDKTAALQEVR